MERRWAKIDQLTLSNQTKSERGWSSLYSAFYSPYFSMIMLANRFLLNLIPRSSKPRRRLTASTLGCGSISLTPIQPTRRVARTAGLTISWVPLTRVPSCWGHQGHLHQDLCCRLVTVLDATNHSHQMPKLLSPPLPQALRPPL